MAKGGPDPGMGAQYGTPGGYSPATGGFVGAGTMPTIQELIRTQQRQKLWETVGKIGQGLLAAGAAPPQRGGGNPLAAGLAQGLALNGGNRTDPLDTYLKYARIGALTSAQKDKEDERAADAARAAAYYGPYSEAAGGAGPLIVPGVVPGYTAPPDAPPLPAGITETTGQIPAGTPYYGSNIIDNAPAAMRPYLRAMDPKQGTSELARMALEASKPRPGFTLSPGGARFDAEGKKIASLPGKPERPLVHRFVENGQEVDKQWNPETKRWETMSQGPRWNPTTGGVTEPQKANNAEIDQARAQLQSLAMNRQDLQDALRPSDPMNPYSPPRDPMIATLVRKALQRKVGDDPRFAGMYDYVYGTEPYQRPGMFGPQGEGGLPAPAQAPGTAPTLLPPGKSVPYQPGDSGYLLPNPVSRTGSNDMAPASDLYPNGINVPTFDLNGPTRRTQAVPAPAPATIPPSRGGQNAMPMPRLATGKIDPSRLKPGQSYTMPDGRVLTWDGQQFTLVR